MGKRPLVRRRGRGGFQFRSTSTGKVGSKAKYPRFSLSEQHEGLVIDLVHERGREAPLAKVRFEDGSVSFMPAVLGTKVGETLQMVDIRKEKSDIIFADTTGLISGEIGRVLKIGKIRAIKPEYIIALQRHDEVEHILNLVEDIFIYHNAVPYGKNKR